MRSGGGREGEKTAEEMETNGEGGVGRIGVVILGNVVERDERGFTRGGRFEQGRRV